MMWDAHSHDPPEAFDAVDADDDVCGFRVADNSTKFLDPVRGRATRIRKSSLSQAPSACARDHPKIAP